jgi:hypothetical protein
MDILLKVLRMSWGKKLFQTQLTMKPSSLRSFFAAGLWMSPQPVLTDILVKFRVQLHELTLNAFARLSKYFCAVMSFSGNHSSDGFAKHYKLHY